MINLGKYVGIMAGHVWWNNNANSYLSMGHFYNRLGRRGTFSTNAEDFSCGVLFVLGLKNI